MKVLNLIDLKVHIDFLHVVVGTGTANDTSYIFLGQIINDSTVLTFKLL